MSLVRICKVTALGRFRLARKFSKTASFNVVEDVTVDSLRVSEDRGVEGCILVSISDKSSLREEGGSAPPFTRNRTQNPSPTKTGTVINVTMRMKTGLATSIHTKVPLIERGRAIEKRIWL